MATDFLKKAFHAKSVDETERFYDDWADSYEQTHLDMGYLAPKRCAEALAHFAGDKSAPVLDIGCGTGLSGIALRQAGFTNIIGTDLSTGMLAKAGQHAGVYTQLIQADLSQGLPESLNRVCNAVAAGVFSPGHAPASALSSIVDALEDRGCFAFSLNDHSLEDASYQAAIDEQVGDGVARELFREHDINVPGTGLYATVVVLQKTI